MALLVVNAGSSSLKFSLFKGDDLLARGLIDRLGLADHGQPPRMRTQDSAGSPLHDDALQAANHEQALPLLLNHLRNLFAGEALEAVGHRVVHGGDRFTAPTRIDADVLAFLESLVPLAPLHQPHALGPIRALAAARPELPQVACFDTAFHATQDPIERMYALPRSYYDRGVKKYGFHGLSYEYIASQLPKIDARAAAGKAVVFHLGNGASACALKSGRSVANSMGFTALDGLVMGTRSGSIDPGVLLYVLQAEKKTPDQLADLLYKQSGLLGVSGLSADMRDLLQASQSEAADAVELFCHRAAGELGRFAMVLGGLDAIVFTAGIGENAPQVRARICAKASWLGVTLAADANQSNQATISSTQSRVGVFVIPTNEERMIATHCRTLLRL